MLGVKGLIQFIISIHAHSLKRKLQLQLYLNLDIVQKIHWDWPAVSEEIKIYTPNIFVVFNIDFPHFISLTVVVALRYIFTVCKHFS